MKNIKIFLKEMLIELIGFFVLFFFITSEFTHVCIYWMCCRIIKNIILAVKYKKTNKYRECFWKNAKYCLTGYTYRTFGIVLFFVSLIFANMKEEFSGIIGFLAILLFIIGCIYAISFMINQKENNKNLKIKREKYIEKYGSFDEAIKYENIEIIVTHHLVPPELEIIANNANVLVGSNEKNECYNLLQFLEKNNYILETTMIMNQGNANLLCVYINKILKALNLNISIKVEEITKFDNEQIKARRRDFQPTFNIDMNIINDILNKKGYQLLVFEIEINENYEGDEGHFWAEYITVMTIENINKLKNLEKDSLETEN